MDSQIGTRKKKENTGFTLAVLFGVLCLMLAGLAISDWRYYAAIQRDPVTVSGTVTDIGGKNDMAYEYEFLGKKYEGTDRRRNARGKWVGSPIDVVLSQSSPGMSSVNPEFLRTQARQFGWLAAGLLALSMVAAVFGIRRARHGPPPESVEVPARKGSVTAAVVFLAGVMFVTSAAAIGMARLSGEKEWLLQASATLSRPGAADEKVAALGKSVEGRLEDIAGFAAGTMWMVGVSMLVLVAVAVVVGYMRRRV